jgi:hypothetical protein
VDYLHVEKKPLRIYIGYILRVGSGPKFKYTRSIGTNNANPTIYTYAFKTVNSDLVHVYSSTLLSSVILSILQQSTVCKQCGAAWNNMREQSTQLPCFDAYDRGASIH